MFRPNPRQFTIANILWWTFFAGCYLAFFRASSRTQFWIGAAFFVFSTLLLLLAMYWATTELRGTQRVAVIVATALLMLLLGLGGYGHWQKEQEREQNEPGRFRTTIPSNS
jgi:peptidoglycan/LPS O-acetylase OafA/YrhL